MLTNSIFRLNDTKLQEAISYIISQGQNPAYALEVAEILLTIYPNNNTVIAGLLSTAISTTDLSKITLPLQQISSQFGIEIANIVEGILKTSTIHYLPYNIRQAQKFFDFLLSMPQEVAVGVLFVKLAHLLHNISIFSVNPTLEKYAISALEIIEIYVPLMSRVGFEAIKIELQEICLTILQPDIREYILTHLYAFCGKDIKALITKIINSLHNSLQAEGIQAKIFGRIKTPYSIWLKMLQKNINIGQLYDILAFRIIVENVEDCYKALAVMHAHYQSVKGQFQDYIHRPKSNGYQSLHTIIIGPTRQNIEIQIRTCAMNEKAQHGTAAHWKYKKKPAIIKEKVYNIYQSLYQSAYLPLINILKTPAKDRDIKQRIHRLYKFESYKELGILRNINSRLSFNDHATNIYQNNNNTILTLLEPNINSDFNHRLPSPHDMIVSCSVDSISDYPTAQLVMNDLTTFQQTNLLLDTYSAETYLSSDSNSTPHLPPQLMPKTEPLKFQTPPNNISSINEPSIQNALYNRIIITISNIEKDESGNYDLAVPLLEEQPAQIELQILQHDSEQLDTVPLAPQFDSNGNINPPDENSHSPLTEAIDINRPLSKLASHREFEEDSSLQTAAYGGVCEDLSLDSTLKFPEIDFNEVTSASTVQGLQDDDPPFLLAIKQRNIQIIQEFLSHPNTDITQKTQAKETALILAIQTLDIKTYQLLVSHFQANWQNIFKNDIKEFKEYINWQDHFGRSAFSYATEYYLIGGTDNPAIIKALLEWKGSQQEPLISSEEQEDVWKQLLEEDEGYISKDAESMEDEDTIVNSGEFGARSDGTTAIDNRQETSDDVTNFSSIDYKSPEDSISNTERRSTLRKIAEENIPLAQLTWSRKLEGDEASKTAAHLDMEEKAIREVSPIKLIDIEMTARKVVEDALSKAAFEVDKIKEIPGYGRFFPILCLLNRKAKDEKFNIYSPNYLEQEVTDTDPINIERTTKELAEYKLREAPYEEWTIQNIGECDDLPTFG
ncbi:HD domain-containing protein [Candidatus Tisiphia endosymbiont of Beris chalybata]|uniref:HD domain-containing protein n=1 Tax=Candidatus Tisiphia endosymbiont of Beris chalybata TaxID=3066262 RepID=UPI00312C964D